MRAAAHQTALATVIRALSAEKDPGCLLDSQGTFLFVNEAWDNHALATGTSYGDSRSLSGSALIGTSWLEHIQCAEVREVHAQLLSCVMKQQGPRARPLLQVAEHNTPTTAALLSTRFEAVWLHGTTPLAVHIVRAIVRERPVEEVYDIVHRPAEAYRDPQGRTFQCACCRRLRDPTEPERWDFVPELLVQPILGATQVLCELCAELHCKIEHQGPSTASVG